MSQEVLIDVYLVSDTDAWKIIFVTGKRNYAKVFHKQDRLEDVQSKLLEIVEKIEHSLPDPRSPTLRAPAHSEHDLSASEANEIEWRKAREYDWGDHFAKTTNQNRSDGG